MNISNVSASGAMTSAPVAAVRRAPPPPTPHGQVAQAIEYSSVELKQMVTEMQNQINKMNVSLEFTTYGDRGENIAVVVSDKGTGEVIREIPPKEIQQLYAKMNELSGMILSGKA